MSKPTEGPYEKCKGHKGKGCNCGLVWSTPQDIPIAKAYGRNDEKGIAGEECPSEEERQANQSLLAASWDLLQIVEALYKQRGMKTRKATMLSRGTLKATTIHTVEIPDTVFDDIAAVLKEVRNTPTT